MLFLVYSPLSSSSIEHSLGMADYSSCDFLNNDWVTLRTQARGQDDGRSQLVVRNLETGAGQILTKGPFHHELVDYHDGQFLVKETPVGENPTDQSRLFIIEPQRVRM